MRHAPLALALLSSVALVTSGCGDEAPETELTTLESLTIGGDAPMVMVGEQVEFTVSGRYSDGSTKRLTADVTWTSADPTIAGQVSGGTFEGLAGGEVEITAAAAGKSASITLTVTASALLSMEVQPRSAMLEIGQTREFTAFGKFDDGSRVDITAMVAWSSADPAVASVASGLVSAVAAGQTQITATSNSGVTASSSLTVTAPLLVSIDVGEAFREVPLGLQLQLEATGTYSDGTTRPITEELTWASNNAAILTVSNQAGTKGLITSVSEGQTTVNVSHLATGMGSNLTVRVLAAELAALTITPSSSTIAAGATAFLRAQGRLTDGSTTDLTREVSWTSSDPTIAFAYDSSFERGEIEGRGAGTARITVTHASGLSSDESGGSATVTVTPPSLQSITVEPRSPSVAAGLTQQFTAFGNFTDGVRRDISASVTWSTSDTSLATIDSAGLLTGLAPGNLLVSALEPMSGVNSGAAGSAQLTVTPAQLVSLAVMPATVPMAIGDTRQLTATGAFTDGMNRDVTSQCRWASNSSAVSVSVTGEVTANVGGMATITATHNATGITSAASMQDAIVTVAPLQLLTLVVTPSMASLPVGVEIELTATGTYNNGDVLDMTNTVEWTSSTPMVASVPMTGPLAGTITTVSPGSTVISVRDPVSGLTSDTAGTSGAVTVSAAITLSSLQVVAPATTVLLGSTTQLSAQGTFSNQSVFDLTNSVTWSSSNPTVASVSNTAGARGALNALLTGSTVVSAVHGPTGVASAMNPTINVLVQPVVTFNFTGAPQTWTVPMGITSLEVEAAGAAGGTGSNGGIGGLGARIVATVPVTGGELLTIIVGGAGGNGTGTIGGGGGGGGSFVSRPGAALVIAAGGGGASYQAPGNTHGQPGLTTELGGPGGYSTVAVGAGGFTDNGGGGGTGSGGGGWNSGGTSNRWCTGGQAAGGTGGAGVYNNPGGFGGGGGSMHGGGGGGGYTGGSGGTYTIGGGGGGSYNLGTRTTAQSGVRAGNGQVILRPVP